MSKEETKQEETPMWVKKVMHLLKLDDEGKVTRFHGLMVKHYKKEIIILEKQIVKTNEALADTLDDANEKLIDKKEERDSLAITVDATRIGGEEKEKYMKVFDENLAHALNNVKMQEDYIVNLKKEAEEKVKSINTQIDAIKDKLALLGVN